MNRLPFVVSWVGLLLVGSLRAETEDLDTQLMRATVKVSHEKSTGTGFLLCRPDRHAADRRQVILLTAAHVFETIPGDEALLFFRKKEAEGVYKKLPSKLVLRKDGKPRWVRHPSQDVAALVVVPPDEADLPRLPVDLLATDEELKKYRVGPGDILACQGFPHRVEANDAGFPILRSGSLASFPIVPTRVNRTFLFSANIFDGDSGAPVYLAGSRRGFSGDDKEVRLILGLVTGQHFLDEQIRMVYGSTRVRHRLGLAIVVHSSFLRETLERLP